MGVLGEVRDTLGFDVLRFGSMQNGPKQQTSRNVGLLQPPGQNSGASAQEDSIPSLEVWASMSWTMSMSAWSRG